MEIKTKIKNKLAFWPRNRSHIYIISVVFGLIILFLIFLLIFPYFQEIKKNSEDLTSIKNSLAFLGDQVSEVEKFKNNYETYKTDLEKIAQLYVDSKNPAGLFKFLEKIAFDNQVKSEIFLLADTPARSEAFINFQIFSQSEFMSALNFLEKLETGPYLIEIKNLSITNSKQDGALKKSSIKLVDANFLVKVYTKTQ